MPKQPHYAMQTHARSCPLTGREPTAQPVPAAAILVAFLLAALAGCQHRVKWSWDWPFVHEVPSANGARDPGTGPDEHPFRAFEQPQSPAGPAPSSLEVVMLEFKILRAELPVEPRHSRKIWNHVDELRIDPGLSPLLARNGLRVGVCMKDAWEAVEAVLKSSDSITTASTQSIQIGLPLVMNIGAFEPNETLFVHHTDGGLTGQTFAEGRKALRLDYELVLPRRERIRLSGEFAVLPPENKDLSAVTLSAPGEVTPTHRFTDLVFTLVLDPGEVVVVGPHESTVNELLLGSRYFTRQGKSRSNDVVLFITADIRRQKFSK